jgi:cytochrome c biogenesis protein CcdA
VKRYKLLLIPLFLSLTTIINAGPVFRVKPLEITFEPVRQGTPVSGSFAIKNAGTTLLTIEITTTCPCLEVDNSDDSIEPGEILTINYTFDTTLYSGFTSNSFIITTNDPDVTAYFLPFDGAVLMSGESTDENQSFFENSGNGRVPIYLYGNANCGTCKPVYKLLQQWLKEDGNQYNLTFYNLETVEGRQALTSLFSELDYRPSGSVLLYDGETVYSGKEGVEAFMQGRIQEDSSTSLVNYGLAGVIFAGLVDGINPCAFTVIILLISYLLLQFKSRRHIILVGTLYILTVFITYFLIGLGLFEILRRLSFFPIVKEVIRWLLSGGLVILAGVSVYDFVRVLQGRSSDMLLKLPGYLQNVVRKTIRNEMKDFVIIGSSLFLGFIVSLTELVCTGQVYIPVLVHLARTDMNFANFAQLLIYNVSFIIPLTIIFVLVVIGFSSQQIGDFFKKNVALVKLLFILLFLGFAIFNFLVQ